MSRTPLQLRQTRERAKRAQVLGAVVRRFGDFADSVHAVRAHLLEMAGELDDAIAEYRRAAGRTTSVPEQRYLTTQAARLGERRS